MLFPFTLTFIGLLVVGAGVVWSKLEEAFTARLRGTFPEGVRKIGGEYGVGTRKVYCALK